MSTYRVADNTQMNVDGTVYAAGETFTASAEDTAIVQAVAGGWIVEDDTAPPKKGRS